MISPQLEQAASILQEKATDVVEALTSSRKEEAMDRLGSAAFKVNVEALPEGFEPPVGTMGSSCVYIARRKKDGWFYVGSTDGLKERITDHRQQGGSSLVQDPRAEFVFVQIPKVSGAASAARSIEASVIREMAESGFGLLSTSDARKRHMPSSEE